MKKIYIAIILICFVSITAFSQTTGRYIGTVSSFDGVITGAMVVVRDNQTVRELSVQTKDDGSFSVQQLEFGTYTVTITAPGFKTFTATELKIDARRENSLNTRHL